MPEPSPIFTVPLFPLHHVLFPFIPLQLHVFEERYRVMINHCIDTSRPFGVVLIREGEEVGEVATPHDVGCLARILGVQRLDDGRMYLIAAGEQRFRLLDYVEADLPYLIGKVEFLDDMPHETDEMLLAARTHRVKESFIEYLVRLAHRTNREVPEMDLPEDPAQLSFCIAAVAQFTPLEKQHLLEMTNVAERLEVEASLLFQQTELWDAEDAENDLEDEPGNRIIIARSLDPEQDLWKRFLDESKN